MNPERMLRGFLFIIGGVTLIKAAIFDLDGTLINSIADLANSTNYALEVYGFPTHSVEKYKYFIGDGMLKLIERALPENKRDDDIKAEVLNTFMEHYRLHFLDKTVLYNGIDEILSKLSDMGVKLAVISNKIQEMASVIEQKLFADTFVIFYGKREGYPTKPDPTLTKEVIKKLGVKPCECVFIGDSGMDALTAVNAGCIGIGVLWGFREREELLQNGAKYIAQTPNDILQIIKEIGV